MTSKKRKPKHHRRRPAVEADRFESALSLHRNGQLAEAEQAYRQVLKGNTNHTEALHLLGLVLHRRGKSAEAVELLRLAIASREDYGQAINDLGNMLHDLEQLDEAAWWFGRLIRLEPDNSDAYNNLGLVLKDQGKLTDAIAAYTRAIELNPGNAAACCNLGNAFKKNDNLNEAATAYRKAIALQPQLLDAHRNLCAVLRAAGKLQEARDAFEQWLKYNPDNPIAQHMMAACSDASLPHASDDYVRQVFDQFASTFDEHLTRLDYSGPQLIAEAIAQELPAADKSLDVLDAGCGTGLCGPQLRPYARTLVGVDLSPKMLARARQSAVYDELFEAELTSFLHNRIQAFDLLVAADTLIYFGDLTPVWTAAAQSLRDDGLLVVTLETPHHESGSSDYKLNPNGRYSHLDSYARRSLTEAGLTIRAVRSVVLRSEADQPVWGMVVRAKKEKQA